MEKSSLPDRLVRLILPPLVERSVEASLAIYTLKEILRAFFQSLIYSFCEESKLDPNQFEVRVNQNQFDTKEQGVFYQGLLRIHFYDLFSYQRVRGAIARTAFAEIVYEEALALSLTEAGFTVARQVSTPIWFHGKRIGEYKADLIVNNAVLIELKSAQALDTAHHAQVLNYLRSTDIEVALLLNFGPKASFKRLVFENTRKGIRVSSRASAGS